MDTHELYLFMEFLLHGLAEYSLLSKHHIEFGTKFKDMLSSMFSNQVEDENDQDYFNDDDYKY